MEGSKTISRGIQRLVRRLPDSISGRLIRGGLRFDRSRVDGIVFKIAETRDELEQAYGLVHNVYVQEGYADPNDSGIRVNLRYALPTTTTFVGKQGNRVVMTMTLIGDTPLGLPMDMIFSQELYELRSKGRYIAEVGAFASDPDFRRRQQMAAFYTNKIMWTYAVRHLGVDDLVIAVNPKHEWIYKHLLLFESIAGLRLYNYVKDAPAIAMRLDLQTVIACWQRWFGDQPPEKNLLRFFVDDDPERVQLPETEEPYNVWNEELFSYFFVQRTDPRRDGAGSLLDLYRMMYTLPNGPTQVPKPSVPRGEAENGSRRVAV